MKIRLIKRSSILLLAVFTTAACSTGSEGLDAGQRISQRGGEISDRGQSWTDGQRDQRKGQKIVNKSVGQVSDGENDLKRAQAAVLKAERRIEVARADKISGEELINSGTAKMRQAEADYSALRNGPSAMAPR